MKRYTQPLATTAYAVPNWWEPLFGKSSKPSIFLSAAWLQSWLDIYGKDFEGYWIRWEKEGAIVGGCLLVIRTVRKKKLPFHSIYLNASGEAIERTPLAEFNDILQVPGYESEIAADLVKFIFALSWSRLEVSGYVEGGFIDHLVAELPAAAIEREPRPSPYVDLIKLGDESFDSTLTSNTRGQIRRSQQLYQDGMGALLISPATSLDEAIRFFEELALLHNARWQAKGASGSFDSTAVKDFHLRLIPRLWQRQAVDLLRVSAGETVIGYLYNFIEHGKVFFFQSGFTYEANPKLKPGLVTHLLAIEHYKKNGLHEYDFLAGDAQYKRSMTRQQRTLYWTVIYRDRAWVRFLLLLRRIKVKLTSAKRCFFP